MPFAVLDKSSGTYVIPAQHTTRLSAILAGKQPPPVPIERIVQQVFSADYAEVYDIPVPCIIKLTKSGKATRLVLCGKFDPTRPRSCLMGDRCNFVHADTRSVPRRTVHINYAWRDLAEVKYECFPPGRPLHVAAPGAKEVTDIMDSAMVLKTKALDATASQDRTVLTHCAHYYLNRTCNLGSDCQFIHAVYLDPTARPHQRAPAPTQMGRGASEAQVIKSMLRHEAARRLSEPEPCAEYGATCELSDDEDDHHQARLPRSATAPNVGATCDDFRDESTCPMSQKVFESVTKNYVAFSDGDESRPGNPLVSAMLAATPLKDGPQPFPKAADRSTYLAASTSVLSASFQPSMSLSSPGVPPFRHDPYRARPRSDSSSNIFDGKTLSSD